MAEQKKKIPKLLQKKTKKKEAIQEPQETQDYEEMDEMEEDNEQQDQTQEDYSHDESDEELDEELKRSHQVRDFYLHEGMYRYDQMLLLRRILDTLAVAVEKLEVLNQNLVNVGSVLENLAEEDDGEEEYSD